MSNWQIGESGTKVVLDDRGQGEVTFTVTNAGTQQDRSVLTVEALDGAGERWFSVEEPQRAVPAGGSVTYLCRIQIPPGTAAGTYALQAIAYSADRDPAEGSAKSRRVVIGAKAKEAVPKELPTWVPIAIILAVLVIVALVLWLVLRGGGEPENTTPSSVTGEATATSVPTGPVAPASPVLGQVPDVTGLTRSAAFSALIPPYRVEVLGVVALSGSCDPLVTDQTPEAGTALEPGEQVVISTQPATRLQICGIRPEELADIGVTFRGPSGITVTPPGERQGVSVAPAPGRGRR